MIPPEIQAELEALTLYQVAIVIIAVCAGGWALWKAGSWLVTRFFPGVVAAAKGVVDAAQLLAAVKDLPDFIERTDSTLAAQNDRIGEIHHEVHFNNGGSVKDAVVRVERTAERLEEGVRGLHERMGAVDTVIADLVPDDTKDNPQ